MVTAVLRLNMTNAPGAAHGERYRAALDMAEYADRAGFAAVAVEEHHLARSGWLPSPLVLAAAIAARTRSAHITVAALLVPLYDPVRLAEDIAVLDNLSDGRFSFVAGVGYRPAEYRAVGRDWARRGALMDHCLEVMLKAWGDEPFEHAGQLIDVTPKPRTRPHPFFFVGGMSRAAARRAARFGVPFYPPMEMPELAAYYHAELARRGATGFVHHPERRSAVVFVHEDPDAAWAELGPYLLDEHLEYCSWRDDSVPRPYEDPVDTVAALREQGKVHILTPDQCRADIASGRRELVLHPLAGGVPAAAGWNSLRLFVEQVLPRVDRQPGAVVRPGA